MSKYSEEHPDKKVIRLGIGDVFLPLGSKVIEGLHKGVDAQASSDTFKGYGPEQGYGFLRINSGGGDAYASEQIWRAVKELNKKKPVCRIQASSSL